MLHAGCESVVARGHLDWRRYGVVDGGESGAGCEVERDRGAVEAARESSDDWCAGLAVFVVRGVGDSCEVASMLYQNMLETASSRDERSPRRHSDDLGRYQRSPWRLP